MTGQPEQHPTPSPASQCVWLLVAGGALWIVLFWPARMVGGAAGVEGLTFAALLCVVPGCAIFVLGSLFRTLGGQPQLMVMAGMTLRLLAVLGGLLAVRSLRPDLGFRELTVWVVVFYLAMLLVETLLVTKLARRPRVTADSSGRTVSA